MVDNVRQTLGTHFIAAIRLKELMQAKLVLQTSMRGMSSTTFSVRIDSVTKKRLEKLAKSTGRSRSFLAAEAINEYLDLNEWQVAGIQKAVASLDAARGFRMSGSKSG
jgi:predicted transcriptional regulator